AAQGQGPAQPAASATAAQGQGPAQPAANAKDEEYSPYDTYSPQRSHGPNGPTESKGGGGRAGRRRVSSSMTKKIKFETRRFKKSLKRYLHLRVPRFMPGGGGGGGTAFKSGYAAL
ncbi:MAG: hypothetical protein EBZ77_14890, partial [Chitinophagia bacterium]|nr:hypothetical protein [Chitinophagia bacterium]